VHQPVIFPEGRAVDNTIPRAVLNGLTRFVRTTHGDALPTAARNQYVGYGYLGIPGARLSRDQGGYLGAAAA